MGDLLPPTHMNVTNSAGSNNVALKRYLSSRSEINDLKVFIADFEKIIMLSKKM